MSGPFAEETVRAVGQSLRSAGQVAETLHRVGDAAALAKLEHHVAALHRAIARLLPGTKPAGDRGPMQRAAASLLCSSWDVTVVPTEALAQLEGDLLDAVSVVRLELGRRDAGPAKVGA